MSKNKYRCSDGTRVAKSVVDARVRKAKEMKIQIFLEEHGYLFCEVCGENNCQPIDCSHDISVDKCQKMGKTELAWDVNNITLRGRKCHEQKDGLDLRFTRCQQ